VVDTGSTARRVFVTAWVAIGLAGALNATIAERLLGTQLDLRLPQLEYGFVMFNRNAHEVTVYSYVGPDGARRPLSELVSTPAPGYADARLAVNLLLRPDYLQEVCYRATAGSSTRYVFVLDHYDMDTDPRRPAQSLTLHCDARGLSAE
jgi:hypothetical protein